MKRKLKLKLNEKVVFEAGVTAKSIDRDNAIIEFTFSTDSLDRHGERIFQNFTTENLMKNPVFLNSHRYGDATETIGKILDIKTVTLGVDKKATSGRVQFAVDANPKAKIIFDLYAGGFLHAVSIGAIPLEFDPVGNLLKSELIEVSAVSVPANAEALAKQKGIDVSILGKAEDIEEDEIACCDCGEVIEGEPHERAAADDTAEALCCSCAEADAATAAAEVKALPRVKDVAETVALAMVVDHLNFLVKAFARNGVSQDTIDIMLNAQTLLLEALKAQAVVGQKNFKTSELFAEIEKEGRVLSEKNRKLVGDAASSLKETAKVLDELLSATEPAAKAVVPAPAKPLTPEEQKNASLRSITLAIESMKRSGEPSSKVETRPGSPDVRAENLRLINRSVRSLIELKRTK